MTGASNGMPVTVDGWCKAINEWAEEKGWNEPRPFGDTVALMHTELSEAFEEWRKTKAVDDIYYEDAKPEGVPVELADCAIRIMHWFAQEGLSLQRVLETKHLYNQTRPYRHGGKHA